MPYLTIQSNQTIEESRQAAFLSEASALVAAELAKPESYVMVTLELARPMIFAGSDAPAAYLELKSIGLNESQTKPLSAALCQLIHNTLNVSAERIYIEFSDAPRSMWGWNSSTF